MFVARQRHSRPGSIDRHDAAMTADARAIDHAQVTLSRLGTAVAVRHEAVRVAWTEAIDAAFALGDLSQAEATMSMVSDLAPGLIATPANSGEAGQFSASGQRPNKNYLTVDGVNLSTGVAGAGAPGLFPA